MRERYVTKVALSYPGKAGRHVQREAGEECPDVPVASVPWLLEQGAIGVDQAAPIEMQAAGAPTPVESVQASARQRKG